VAKVEHLAELVEVPDPDHMTAAERRTARLAQEEAKFNPDHYMYAIYLSRASLEGTDVLCRGDFVMDEEIQEFIAFMPHWVQERAALAQQTPVDVAIPFTDDEKMILAALPNRNCTVVIAYTR
jgi:hypothetical protein